MLVNTDPHNEIGEAWAQFRDGAVFLSLFGLLVLGPLHLAMARLARPHTKTGRGFDAVGGGDYHARVTQRPSRELAWPPPSIA